MKKSVLSLSIATMLGGLTLGGAVNAAVSVAGTGGANNLTATNATTLDINPAGIGHINVVPYFSTQNGNNTLLSITNTDTVNGKAVKVRFRSAANSDDIFDFTLFLSPGDIWTANVSRSGANGVSLLTTTDKSCTLPASVNGTFIVDRLPPVSGSFSADSQSAYTREGYVEILNLADVPPNLANVAPAKANALFTATKHVNGVAPCTATAFNPLLNATAPTEAELVTLGFDTPTGGLYTNAFIINTSNAFLSWTTETTAIRATQGAPGNVNGRGRVVFAPQTGGTVAAGVANTLTADPQLIGATPALPPLEFDFPDLSTPYVGNGALVATVQATTGGVGVQGSADAQALGLGQTFAALSIANDFTTLAAIGAKTDLTFVFPTRRYSTAVNYATVGAAANSGLVFNTQVPFFNANNTTRPAGFLACVNTGNSSPVVAYDREETTQSSGFVISPGTASTLTFCGEASVLTVNNPGGPGVLGGQVAVKDLTVPYTEGWATVLTPGTAPTIAPAVAFAAQGLPVLGSAYSSARGNVVAGTSTNFGWTYKHKAVLNRP